ILAAYAHRLKTGEGQWVETSLYEAALVQTYWQSAIALATGVAPRAMGSAHPLNAPYQAFEASDGWIVVGGANRKHWLLMLEALDAPELASDPRFLSRADRMAHLKELEGELSRRFRTKSAAHWLAALEQKGVPCGPVQNMLQALADPQTLARDMVVEVEHASLGPVKTVGLPVKFSATPGKVRHGAPRYGEHTREVLREAGFDDRQIDAFEQEGAITTASARGVRQAAGRRRHQRLPDRCPKGQFSTFHLNYADRVARLDRGRDQSKGFDIITSVREEPWAGFSGDRCRERHEHRCPAKKL